MRTENSDPKGAEQTHSHAPPAASPLRLVILLSVLVVFAGALLYDWVIAPPRVKAAYDKLKDKVLEHNETSFKLPKGAEGNKEGDSSPDGKAGGLLYSQDIQKILGMAPSKVDKQDLYTIETYCWWGWIPRNRNFITVLYVGSPDKPHYSTHYANEMPEDGVIPGKWKSSPPDIDLTSGTKGEKAGFPLSPPGGGMGAPGMDPLLMDPPTKKGEARKMAPPNPSGGKGKGRPPGNAEKIGSEPTGVEEESKKAEESKKSDEPAKAEEPKKEASGEGEKKEPTKAEAKESK